MIKRIAATNAQPQYGSPGAAACHVKLVPQIKTWWCGYATTLQTLYGLGKQGTVSGSTDAQKQTKIANDMGDPNNSAIVYKICNYLNARLSTGKYSYYLGSSQTVHSFSGLVGSSLMLDRPVILHARTQSLPYYNGKNLAHYLSLDTIEVAKNKVRIVDCNYDTRYQGTHYVSIAEAYGTVSPAGRYFITR